MKPVEHFTQQTLSRLLLLDDTFCILLLFCIFFLFYFFFTIFYLLYTSVDTISSNVTAKVRLTIIRTPPRGDKLYNY